jgi:glycolate oxidase iron-sulfur subunit
MDVLYGPVNHAAVRVLCAQRQIVEVPEQTCCGALAFHSGESDITINLAKRNITSFENRQGPIIVTSAGCSAMLKEYDGLFAQGDEFRKRAKAFSARVMDVSEFVSAHPLPETIRQRARALFPTVAYHAACHLAHAQNVRTAPEQLLRQVVDDVNSGHADAQVPAMRLMPLLDKEHCCGSAGIFNILHPELSDKVLEAKMQKLEESGAKIVITSNPGCLLQLELGIKRQALPMRVMHLIELLDQVYGLGGQDD